MFYFASYRVYGLEKLHERERRITIHLLNSLRDRITPSLLKTFLPAQGLTYFAKVCFKSCTLHWQQLPCTWAGLRINAAGMLGKHLTNQIPFKDSIPKSSDNDFLTVLLSSVSPFLWSHDKRSVTSTLLHYVSVFSFVLAWFINVSD